jgi:CBS domain-containing protein
MHTVEEAMTHDVVTVWPHESVTVAARIMRDAGVSGLPVIDADRHVVGILTEADLLHRAVLPDSAHDRARDDVPESWSKATVADLMSREVLGVRRSDPLAKAARLMEKARVRRLVVVGDGFRLEGIISRRDVVAALARSDAEIEAEIRSGLVEGVLGLEEGRANVAVTQGVVALSGNVAHRREAVQLERLAARVLGVSRVESTLTWDVDTGQPRRAARLSYFATRRERPERSSGATHAGETDSTSPTPNDKGRTA